MRTALKIVGIILLVIAGLGLVGVLFVTMGSDAQANTEYVIDTAELTIPTDEASLAEGQRQAAIRGCTDCHGSDLSGKLFIDDPALGVFYATNLTPAEGSSVAGYTPADWERAIRHGVNREGKPIWIMPSTDYYRMSDEDLARMIAYLQSLGPVDQSWPEPQPGPVGRVLVATNQLNFAAEDIDHTFVPPQSVTPEVSAAYGAYLGDTCTGCHGTDFAGGPMPGAAPGDPEPSNLTPAGNLAGWTQQDFIAAMRTGVTPEGKTLDPEFMPWPITTLMSEDELAALWLHLESLPPVERE